MHCVLNYSLHYFFCLSQKVLFRDAMGLLDQYPHPFQIHPLLMCCCHPFHLFTRTHPLPPLSPPAPTFRRIPVLYCGQWLLLSVFPLQLSFWRFYTRLLFPKHEMSQFGSCSAFFTVWSYFTLALDNMRNVKCCYQILKLKWTTWYLNPCLWFYGT